MDGIHIDFTPAGGVLDFNKKSEGFRTTVQNTMVHIGQSTEDSALFPTRGNSLHKFGLQGGFGKAQSFTKALQLLRATLMEFSDSYDEAPAEDKIKKMDLTLTGWGNGGAAVDVEAESNSGEKSIEVFRI